MPDIACEYTLTTPAGTIVFNDGSVDEYFITDIPDGLAGAPLRTPTDFVPYGHGSLSYNFWRGGRNILIEGMFFVRSLPPCPQMVEEWNIMEENLRVCLESIAELDSDTGTLVWTPTGLSQRTLTVRHNVQLQCPPDQNYSVRAFNFGLLADDPDWLESTP
jgi:hypothetical protein